MNAGELSRERNLLPLFSPVNKNFYSKPSYAITGTISFYNQIYIGPLSAFAGIYFSRQADAGCTEKT